MSCMEIFYLLPQNSGFDLTCTVHLQSRNCRAANRSTSNEVRLGVIPAKVPFPFVATWIKKPNQSFKGGIYDHLFLIFVAIAGMTGEGKILKIITAAKNARGNMIDGEPMIE